jgi:hypothetical protein
MNAGMCGTSSVIVSTEFIFSKRYDCIGGAVLIVGDDIWQRIR